MPTPLIRHRLYAGHCPIRSGISGGRRGRLHVWCFDVAELPERIQLRRTTRASWSMTARYERWLVSTMDCPGQLVGSRHGGPFVAAADVNRLVIAMELTVAGP